MQQLWIDGIRMDSIDCLQAMFCQHKDDEIKFQKICVSVMERYHDGTLKRWLSRQEEMYILRERNRKMQLEPLLDNGKDERIPYEALAALCGIPKEAFLYINCGGQEELRDKKIEELKKQSWWPAYESLFGAVKRWELVVLNGLHMDQALEYVRSNGQGPYDIYICNTKEMDKKYYSLNLKGLKNVSIIGVEKPKILHVQTESSAINLEKQNIYLEGLVLKFFSDFRGMSGEDHMKNCEQSKV